ncbi:MAG TPA: tryptophanase [Planctomycetota bacterium]|nr:tryptophanase [Planctomycetota bacterium]
MVHQGSNGHGLPPFEPYRVKCVERLRMTTRAEREELLARAGLNLFRVPAEGVLVDLLTDSGTGAMSDEQWSALMRGDESYAGARSWTRFEAAVRDLTGYEHVIPTHQGRAAEYLLFSALVRPGDVVPSNTHFDTTRANVEARGATAIDLPCPEAADTRSRYPFKGDVDLARLEACLAEHAGQVPLAILTVTNNALGGHPASLANVRTAQRLCRRAGVPLVLDACRFAENVGLLRERDPEYAGRPPREIARELFGLADGCTMSAKKDGLAHIGGFLALRDGALAEEIRRRMVVTEGFPTYGGLAGRDLEAIAQGLVEVLDEDYLAHRLDTVRRMGARLEAHGIPIVRPAGGHAVFLDAGRFLPHVPPAQFPGQALAIELYLEGGLRTCEVGSLLHGARGRPPHELLRLAIPRRTYTWSHLEYAVKVVARVWRRRRSIGGVAIEEAPEVLRHFSARFSRLAPAPAARPAAARGS